MFRTTVILCTIAAQVFGAPKPNGCIEACNMFSTHQTHEALVQQQTAMLNQLQQEAASQIGGLDFTRPGNWTEHNEFRTNGGRGRVVEEQGQVVTGPRRVQYYRKNYSSSHGVNSDSVGLGGVGGIDSTLSSQRLSGGLVGIETPLDSQRLITSTSGRGSAAHHSTYDEQRHHEVHQTSNRIGAHSQRLEDFGERVDGTQQILHQVPTTSGGGNWHRADSWRTDGGRGVVHEEEGQVVNGPTKVKYYRQNYSSSYSSGDVGAAVPSITNLEDELQRVHSQLDSFGREIHQQSTVSQTVGHTGYVDENNLGSTNIRTRPVHVHRTVPETHHTSSTGHRTVIEPVPTTSQRYHITRGDQRFQETQTSGSDYSATNSQIDDRRAYQRPQTYHVVSEPRTTVRKSEDHHVYQETIAPQSQIVLSDSNRQTIDRSNEHLIRTPIHTNTNYKSFHSNDEVQGNRLTTGYTQRMTAEEIRQAQIRQSQIVSQNDQRHHSYSNGNVETLKVVAQQPLAVNRYEEKWSEGYRSHSTVPQPITSGQIVVGQHANYVQTGQTAGQLGYTAGTSHNSHSSRHESGSHFYEGSRTQPERLVTGALTVGSIGQTSADCDQSSGGVTTSEQYQYGAVHHRKYKRDAPEFRDQQSQRVEDLTQQTAGFDDFYHQRSGKLELGQHSQQTEDLTQQTQQSEDLTQQTSGFGDFDHQTSGNFEFGQHQQHYGKLEHGHHTQQTEDLTQQTQQSEDLTQQTQQTEDLTQQTSGFGDFDHQTSGNFEFGQHQQHYGKLEHGHHTQQTEDLTQQTQQSEDLTQQTSGFGDFDHQTSGNFEYGQHQQHYGKLEHGHHTQQTEDLTQQTQQSEDLTQQTQQSEDLTQQTSGFGDFDHQTSGNFEYGQHQQHAGKLEHGHHTQQTEDLTQQTQQTEDLTQQTQQTEDLTQQTSGFGDFDHQTSGNFEYGQHQQHYGKLEHGHHTQQSEDLTQQTQQSEDLTQQSEDLTQQSEDLTQQSEDLTQQSEDLTQQTSGFEDFDHQTSGNFEFGQHQQHYGKLEHGHHTQQSEDLTQQTQQSEDQTVLTPSLDFNHQTDNSWVRAHEAVGHKRHTSEIEQSEDLTQQSEDFTQQSEDLTQQSEDLTQQSAGWDHSLPQTSGKLEIGQQTQQTEDLTQQSAGWDRFSPQTSGKLEIGQESQQTEDLTQQSAGWDRFSPQTSGKLEIGQETQQAEYLTQQSAGWDRFTPQTSGKLEIGQETQQTEDLTQQTAGWDHFSPQTSGKFEIGQETQQSEDLTHQTSGHFELGQHQESNQHPDSHSVGHQHPGSHGSGHDFGYQHPGSHDFGHQHSENYEYGYQHDQHSATHEFGQETQQTEDLTQQTGGFDDFTQQTFGNLQIGQQHQANHHGFGQETQQTEDLTQQTGGFDDFTHQTSGNFQFGQQHQTGHHGFGQETQQTEDLTQQTGGFDDFTRQTSGNLQIGQQHQAGHHRYGQEIQQTEDMTQQTSGFGDFTQQSSGIHDFDQDHITTARPQPVYQPGVKGGRRRIPAPKPTLKPSRTTNIDDVLIRRQNKPDHDSKPTGEMEYIPNVLGIDEVETHGSQKQPTTIPNAQWHQNHHPGDLTNSENQESQVQYAPKSGRSYQQMEKSDSRPSRENNPVEGEESEPAFKVEPRIIEVYGGAGSYDVDHDDDLFSGAKRNPSATIPPNPEGADPWDIREKPIVPVNRKPIWAQPTEETTTAMPEEPTTTPASSFWSRVGHKLSNTYEKAKEKASSIFGK